MAEGNSESDMCWICLEEAAENGSHQLVSPCKCPRKVHPQCLARWQLQQAGRHEEKFCRFCNSELADWKRHLTPEELKPEVSKVQPIMVVYFEGQIHRIPVKQGPDGLDEFTGKIRELFRLPEDVDISLTFGCKEPLSGTHLKLEGMGAFDAAVHCASVAAAERQQKIKKSYSAGNLGSSPALAQSPEPVGRSASSHNMPNTALPPATPPPAAGAFAASPAAEDRRQRFHSQQRSPQQQQQQRHHAGNARSRSFSTLSASGPRSTGVEPPAAFRNILGMLHGTQQQQAPHPGAPSPVPQASPRAGLPPLSPVRPPADMAAAAGQQVSPAASSPQQQQQQVAAALRRDRLSLRQISELKDVPEVDETFAVGNLSGKLRLSLRAFSRKVARSLSFTSKSSGSAAAGAGSSGSAASSMEELPPYAAASATSGRDSSLSITSDSSSRMGSYSTGQPGGRGMSPLPPTTPPGIYSH